MLEAWLRNRRLRATAIFAALLGGGTLIALLLAPLMVPIVLSFVLYALLEPVTSVLARRGLNRNAAALIVLGLTATAVAVAATFLVPQLAAQLKQFQQRVPMLWTHLSQAALDVEVELERITGVRFSTDRFVDQLTSQGNEWARAIVVQASNLLLSATATVLLLPLLTFFLIRDWKGFRNRALNLLPNRQFELGWLIYHRVARQLQIYVRGVMFQSGVMTFITSTGFALLGLESALVLGVIAGVLNLIPYLGPFLAMVPPAVLILGEPPFDPQLVLAAIGVIVAGQLVDNLFVVPGFIASAVDLHPLVVIVGIIVFGNFFGLLGMILAIPALSSAKIVFQGLRQGLKAPD